MFQRHTLDNGITLITETMDTVRSVSIGIWVRVGSRVERPQQGGISHFLEHMCFKGTTTRDTQELAREIDTLGGEFNAFTSKEGTTYYIKVLDELIERGAGLLQDVFLRSTFPVDEIEREKGVVIEEIRMVDDTPDDLVNELLNLKLWGDTPLGRPILGTIETVSAITREDLLAHVKRYYVPSEIVISCAGHFDEKRLIQALNKEIGSSGDNSKRELPSAVTPIALQGGLIVQHKDTHEAHVCVAYRGIAQRSEDRYAVLLLNTILGGGFSSRLFQEIRERQGLAYTVSSYQSSYRDEGAWILYAATAPEHTERVIELATREAAGLAATLDQDEFDRAKLHLKSSIMLGLESTTRRMQSMASQEIYYGKIQTPDEILAEIDSVTIDRARQISERLLSSGVVALSVLGPVEEGRISLPS